MKFIFQLSSSSRKKVIEKTKIAKYLLHYPNLKKNVFNVTLYHLHLQYGPIFFPNSESLGKFGSNYFFPISDSKNVVKLGA